jgi:hypothetical protein
MTIKDKEECEIAKNISRKKCTLYPAVDLLLLCVLFNKAGIS